MASCKTKSTKHFQDSSDLSLDVFTSHIFVRVDAIHCLLHPETPPPRLLRCLLVFRKYHPKQLVSFSPSLLKIFIYLAAPGLSYSLWILITWPGIEPRPSALIAQSLSYWTTREAPWKSWFLWVLPLAHFFHYVLSLPISFKLMFWSSIYMVIIPKSLSLVPEFHTYITNCVLDRVTWMPPQHHMLHILYIQHGIHHLYLLSCFALNSLSWFAASPSAQLPTQKPGLFNIRLSPELHLQTGHQLWSLYFKDTPFCHSWCHSVSWAFLCIMLGLGQWSPIFSPCFHTAHPLSHITLNMLLQSNASKMWSYSVSIHIQSDRA